MCKLIFAITGTTGSGKSSASEIFRSLGVDVIDADKISREVSTPNSKCLQEITACFGTKILFENGELNRRALGSIVFSDKAKLELLTKITHKYIKASVEQKIKDSKSNICAVDGAVIIGSNIEALCKFIVVVTADKEVRKNRIKMRDGISDDDAEKRINSQKNTDFYIAHSDYIIQNNKGLDALTEEVTHIYNKILRERI